jgi:hypothetical protein
MPVMSPALSRQALESDSLILMALRAQRASLNRAAFWAELTPWANDFATPWKADWRLTSARATQREIRQPSIEHEHKPNAFGIYFPGGLKLGTLPRQVEGGRDKGEKESESCRSAQLAVQKGGCLNPC